MRIALPDLGDTFTVDPIAAGTMSSMRAEGGRFTVDPGVYVLSAHGPVDHASLPARIGQLGFEEYHVPDPDPLPARVVHLPIPQHLAGRAFDVDARVVTDAAPDSVVLWIRPTGTGWFRPFPMRAVSAYGYRASIPADALREGPHEYVVSVRQRDSTVTFPEGLHRAPSDWDYQAGSVWRTMIVRPDVPLRLLWPADDAGRLSFSRIGDGWRQGIFRIVPSASGEAAFHLELPVNVDGINPDDYTASLVVKDRIAGRAETVAGAMGVRLRLRGIGPRQRLWLTLMEKDGTSWSAPVEVDSTWTERTLPIADFHVARGVKLPQGYPGTWNYWVGPAEGRGGPGDAIRLPDVERLQLSLRREAGQQIRAGTYGVEVESVTLMFGGGAP
jgi:hypothetical protein